MSLESGGGGRRRRRRRRSKFDVDGRRVVEREARADSGALCCFISSDHDRRQWFTLTWMRIGQVDGREKGRKGGEMQGCDKALFLSERTTKKGKTKTETRKKNAHFCFRKKRIDCERRLEIESLVTALCAPFRLAPSLRMRAQRSLEYAEPAGGELWGQEEGEKEGQCLSRVFLRASNETSSTSRSKKTSSKLSLEPLFLFLSQPATWPLQVEVEEEETADGINSIRSSSSIRSTRSRPPLLRGSPLSLPLKLNNNSTTSSTPTTRSPRSPPSSRSSQRTRTTEP